MNNNNDKYIQNDLSLELEDLKLQTLILLAYDFLFMNFFVVRRYDDKHSSGAVFRLRTDRERQAV